MLGTPRTNTSSSSANGRTPWNQVFQVASASCARIARAPRCQMSVAVPAESWLSTGTSTDVENEGRTPWTPALAGRPVVRGLTPGGEVRRGRGRVDGRARNVPPHFDERQGGLGPARGAAREHAAVGTSGKPTARLDGFSFSVRGSRPRTAASEEAMREAHVPAQQPEAQEDPRFSRPDAHARGPRRAEG